MTENLQEQVELELARIAELDANEQPEAYGHLRDTLEAALEQLPNSGQ
ncbi:MAG: hypothetical protein RL243_1058 [Actinomycetota bacterium]|jgi:hypothetical protein